MTSPSATDTINNFNNSELKDLLDKQKEYEKFDTISHALATRYIHHL